MSLRHLCGSGCCDFVGGLFAHASGAEEASCSSMLDPTRMEARSIPTLAAALPAFQTRRCPHLPITRRLGMIVPPSQRPPDLAGLVLLLPLPSGLSFSKVGLATLCRPHVWTSFRLELSPSSCSRPSRQSAPPMANEQVGTAYTSQNRQASCGCKPSA